MDPTFDVSNNLQDSTMAAKQRFESFKMGGGAPANSLTNYLPKHSHGRSRSRNGSISSLSTLSISASTSASAPLLTSPPELFINTSTNVPSNGPLSKRPTSHHRRRSSVSTRCESAELMGVSLPDLPPSHSEDNINLGDRDSIRRRALWALEGKPDLAFSKVEIPDITSPDLTMPYEFSTKPSFPAGPSAHGLNNLMSKRDSFGKLFGLSSTSKDQLHTLVEEEEEEEDESQEERSGQVTEVIEELKEAPLKLAAPASTVMTKSPSRTRPVSLNLKPLSLVSAVTCHSGNLPTPTLTPTPRHNGLRSLALASSSDAATDISASSTIRHSITTSSSIGSFSRRSSSFSSESSCDLSRKRSSISYKRSIVSVPRNMGALPSPDATPINRHFPDLSDVESIPDQPLSTTEQHFLFKSHNVLLARIIDLERTLRSRSMSQSRPLSIASDTSAATSEPSDEMLQLISDLKAERDELKRDVDGWRMRVADADKQATVLARRVESERREAWVARSRVGLLEVEKNTLEKAIGTKSAELEQSITQSEQSKKECDGMREELDRLRARLRDADSAVDECIRLRAALEQERTRRAELEKLLDNAGLLNTPTIPHHIDGQAKCSLPSRSFGIRPRGLGFQSVQSIESDGSTTDVESVDHSFTKAELTLDAVTEEDEDTCNFYDEDELAGYEDEDEDESDLSFQSPGGSSIGSEDEVDFGPVSVLNEATTQLNSLSKPTALAPSHTPRASLSRTWTFPRGQTDAPVKVKPDDEIDRFFGCLDDDVEDSPLGFEMAKAMFTSSFGSANEDEDEEELPPFLIPSDIGTLPISRGLDVVREEDEVDEGEADDEDDGEFLGEEVEGGIRFTFGQPTSCVNPRPAICISPPPAICISPPIEREPASLARKQIPVLEPFDEEDECALFTLPQFRVQEPITSPSSWPLTSGSSIRPSSKIINPPSSIPRATSLRSFVPTTPPTPPSEVSGRFAATPSYPASSFITPPSRRGGTTPSFIPQPVLQSPSKISTSTKSRFPALRSKALTNVKDDATPRSYGTSEKITVARSDPDTSDTCEYPVPEPQAPTSSFSSIMSSPLAARFSFQTLSNFIPLSWSPGAAAVASHTSPSMNDDDNAAEAASLFASVCPGERRSAERRFVSRDQQLEKLRNRLGDDHKGIEHCLAVNGCGSCKGANIFL